MTTSNLFATVCRVGCGYRFSHLNFCCSRWYFHNHFLLFVIIQQYTILVLKILRDISTGNSGTDIDSSPDLHWLINQARGFNPQGCEFISHPVEQYVCTGKSQSLWDRVVG